MQRLQLPKRHHESFEAVHHVAVSALAKAFALRDVVLVHMSALGITCTMKNCFSRSKLHGERAILVGLAENEVGANPRLIIHVPQKFSLSFARISTGFV